MKNSFKEKYSLNSNNQNINLSESSQHKNKIVKTEKKHSFYWISYIFFTVANSLLASFLIYKMNKLLTSTQNEEILYFLIIYISQLIISSFLSSVILLLMKFIENFLKITANGINLKEYFPNIFRVVTAMMSLGLMIISLYFLIRMSKKETKEYQINFHENYMLLYIFLFSVMIISFAIIIFTVYFIAIIYLRLNKKKLDIDENFIQNIQDELNLNKKKNSSFVPPSDDFIKESQMINKQIQEIRIVTVNSESDKTRKINDLDIHHKSSELDLKRVIETEKKRIKNDIFEFTVNKDKRKESLMDEIKKEIQYTNSPEKRPPNSEFKTDDTTLNKPVLISVDTFKL